MVLLVGVLPPIDTTLSTQLMVLSRPASALGVDFMLIEIKASSAGQAEFAALGVTLYLKTYVPTACNPVLKVAKAGLNAPPVEGVVEVSVQTPPAFAPLSKVAKFIVVSKLLQIP